MECLINIESLMKVFSVFNLRTLIFHQNLKNLIQKFKMAKNKILTNALNVYGHRS